MKCVKDFLQFYNFAGPLLCLTTLWTDEPNGKYLPEVLKLFLLLGIE